MSDTNTLTPNIIKEIQTKLEGMSEKIEDIDRAVNGYPASYKLYKGVRGNNGAIQFDMTPKHRSRRDLGAVFLQAASATGPNVYDWDNKITMALNLSDIAIILNTFRTPPKSGEDGLRIYHDKFKGSEREGQVVTSLSIQRGSQNGWFFNIWRKENGQDRQVRMPISDGEAIEIRNLLERGIIRILCM